MKFGVQSHTLIDKISQWVVIDLTILNKRLDE